MWLMFGSKSKTAITPGGERLKRKCPKCGVTGDFHEARREISVNAFIALELFKDEEVVFVCAGCGEAVAKDQTLPAALTAAEQAQEKKRREAEAAEARRSAERAAAASQKKVDADLAALKKKMGL